MCSNHHHTDTFNGLCRGQVKAPVLSCKGDQFVVLFDLGDEDLKSEDQFIGIRDYVCLVAVVVVVLK